MSAKYYTGQEHQKKRSRDVARCRRGQQNDEYTELANQLPLSSEDASQLDRLSVMRLANSFIKVKHFIKNIDNKDLMNWNMKEEFGADVLEKQLLQALDGFVFVIGPDGRCLYISDNVSTYLGLTPVEVTGSSFYKFIHPCDHEEVAKELGGKIPLEDVEIFDGLFCSDSVFLMSNNLKGGSTSENNNEVQPYRSFFVRMKSTLTSRGKSVNLKASTYRVVHCMGCMKSPANENLRGTKKPILCFVGIGVPLMFTPTFEVPLDRCTFSSHHTLDLTFVYCEEGIEDILGYSTEDVLGKSLYTIHHGCDSEILTNCHKTLLTKGQSVSGYYRLLAKYGGWVWVQTKASIVYTTKSCQPQFVLCVHYAIRQESQKRKSRDAARSRRGQQNDEFLELANQLPINPCESSQLDRLSVMRLANSYVKIKHILSSLTIQGFENCSNVGDNLEKLIPEALDGFVFVVGSDGQCLFISDNVTSYLGLLPNEVTGNSFYKYIHPCDHEEVAKELCGKIPLEDMEIFDGLFCSDSVFMMSNNLKGGSTNKRDIEKKPHRSFFVRIKSTLTSRGKSVNLKASTYRVVHCMGHLTSVTTGVKCDEKDSQFCFIGIGVPLMFSSTFEVPLDQATFSSHHNLDLSFLNSENGIEDILGYLPSEVSGKSLFTFLHGCDQDVLMNCHKTLLTKGQAISDYYRLLAKYGGWVWVQTKASIVYAAKTCQPQFVLCVHYAISGTEEENNLVSFDQVQRLSERQESPGNSPADRTRSNVATKTRSPVIQKLPAMGSAEFQVGGSTGKGSSATQNLNTELSIAMDLTDICPGDEAMPEIDKAMPEIDKAAVSRTECYESPHNKSTSFKKFGEYYNSPAIPPPSFDTAILPDFTEENPDQCAPFIPPPLSDTQIFSVDEKELEMFNLNGFGCDEYVDAMWEISDDFDKENQLPKKDLTKRNLSTPTFFPIADVN